MVKILAKYMLYINGEKCEVPKGINAEEMVPFALAQGGKLQNNLYMAKY